MAPRKKQEEIANENENTEEVFTIDSPWTPSGKTIRQLMTQDSDLMEEINNKWEGTYLVEGKEKIYKHIRQKFRIIDVDSFGYHKWFQDLFDNSLTPPSARKLVTLTTAINRYKKLLSLRFLHGTNVDRIKAGLTYITEWCDIVRNGDYALKGADDIESHFRWYFAFKLGKSGKSSANPEPNVFKTQAQHIRDYESTYEYAMGIQGWYTDTNDANRKIPNAPMALTKDISFSKFRKEITTNMENFSRKQNKTVAQSRLITKVLDLAHEKEYIANFNKISSLSGTLADTRTALRQYAILAFNFNIGLRGATIRRFCYSWMMYYEIEFVAGAIYVHMGSPFGFKQKKQTDFSFAQLMVRHEDVEQCPVGTLIKVLVAEHDIIGEKFKRPSILDEIQTAIEEREAGSNITKPPTWESYRFLHGDNDTYVGIHKSTYSTAYKGMYDTIDANIMKAITHEPHNRIGNRMQTMGVDPRAVSLFNLWAVESKTKYEGLYTLHLDAQGATARAGHRGCCKHTPPIYDCPRDGLNEDFDEFQDLRALVFRNRVPDLLQRAKALFKKYEDIYPAVLFLELLDKFLIRVWLEDAAILQPLYPRHVCYDGHPVFQQRSRWKQLKEHLRKLRNFRSDPNDAENTPISSPQIHDGPSSSWQPLYNLMNQQPVQLTIASMYMWRKSIDDQWQLLNDGVMGKGIPDDKWQNAGATGNESLYNKTAYIYRYIDRAVQDTSQTVDKVISLVQEIANSFKDKYPASYTGNRTRNFADTQFRIATGSKRESSKEWGDMVITLDELYDAFTSRGLPEPTPVYVKKNTQ